MANSKAIPVELKQRHVSVASDYGVCSAAHVRPPNAFPHVNSAARSEMFARPLEASIGLEVRRLRKSIDLTLAELAAAARISPGMLSKIETGSTSPSLGTLNAVAKALNVPIKRLFPETF